MEDFLTFAKLDKKLQAIPEGPAAALSTPPWLAMWNAVGTVGILAGLLPSLLIKFMTPVAWMAFMAQMGIWIALIGYAPYFVRSVWVLRRSFWHWRIEQVQQLDHDYAHWYTLTGELARQPTPVLDNMLRFVRQVEMRLVAKATLVIGSADKLGIAPLLGALAIQANAYFNQDTPMSTWLVVLGMFLAVTYLVGFLASLMRLRLRLYEAVLSEALQEQALREQSA